MTDLQQATLYEIHLVDGTTRWSAGWLSGAEDDELVTAGSQVLVWRGRAALEHWAQQRGGAVEPDLPDEVDLGLDGWLAGGPPPPAAEVAELWHLLLAAPHVGRSLQTEELEEAYDDLVEETPGWFEAHGEAARAALRVAVDRLRAVLRPHD